MRCRGTIVRTGDGQRIARGNRHPAAVFELLTLLLALIQTALRDRSELLTENLLLRHQLAVLTRPADAATHAR